MHLMFNYYNVPNVCLLAFDLEYITEEKQPGN